MSAYYNEFDPGAAAWLRELIKRGLIADGEVDERSILNVRPVDLRGFTQCHFFAGIGGWSYALRLAGWPNDRPVWTGSPPCQPFSAAGKGLGRDDARHLGPHFVSLVRAARPAMLFGEQVASAAVFGKSASGAGKAAARAPEWAWLDDLSDRLEAAHYAVGASDIPAAGVGAPHIRQRTFFGAVRLADASISGRGEERQVGGRLCARDGAQGRAAGLDAGREFGGLAEPNGGQCDRLTNGERRICDGPTTGWQQSDCEPECCSASSRPNAPDSPWRVADWLYCRDAKWRPVESSVLGVVDGLPSGLVHSGAFVPASSPLSERQPGADRKSPNARRVMRLRGYGNAIVPQAAAEFIRAFDEVTA